jgi:hypothetical protein
MVSLDVITVTLSGNTSDYFLTKNDSRVATPAWFNADKSLCIHSLNNRWVLSRPPFDEESIISEFPNNNWPQIFLKGNN